MSVSVSHAQIPWKKTDAQIKSIKLSSEILKQVQEDLVQHPTLNVVSRIQHEGVLSTKPEYHEADAALHDMSILFRFAFCSRIATVKLAEQCKVAAEKNILLWAKTYVPTGNPINELLFAQVFLSIDLMISKLSIEHQKLIRDWVKSFLTASDSFLNKKDKDQLSRVNNHNTWRLFTRSLVGKILKDPAINLQNKKLISDQITQDLLPPAGWKPDPSCLNNVKELQYGSLDFRQRDALHYHEYNLEGWALLVMVAPDLFDSSELSVIENAFVFLKPYFNGEKKHIEFVCSKIGFDLARKNAGIEEYKNNEWKPESARKALRLGRAVFPGIREWTASVADENYDQWLKVFSTIQEK